LTLRIDALGTASAPKAAVTSTCPATAAEAATGMKASPTAAASAPTVARAAGPESSTRRGACRYGPATARPVATGDVHARVTLADAA